MKQIIINSALLFLNAFAFGQASSYTDPIQAYNRLLIEKNNSNGSFRQVGNYKVVGSPYLLGEKHMGNFFAKGEAAYSIHLSYNVYTQEVEFYTNANTSQPLTKEAQLVDSFEIKSDPTSNIPKTMKFVNGVHVNGDDKAFYRVMLVGDKNILLKRYKASLDVVSTNYVQSELRQFELNSEYYYYNHKTKELKKLKGNLNALKKEFKSVNDISQVVTQEDFAANPDSALMEIFAFLNK